jgi:hypothetical protein
MKQQQQRQLDALRRVQDYLNVHAAELGSAISAGVKQQLDDAIARIDAFDNAQGSTKLELDGLMGRRRALAAELRRRHMVPIAEFARARLQGVPDIAALTSSGARLGPSRLVAAARAMATAAAPHLEALVSNGFPPDTITELVAAAEAVSSTMAERASTHVRRVGATKGIEEQLRRAREAVAVFRAVVGKQAAGDLVMLAGWRSAHRVAAKSGATRVAAAAPAAATTTAAAVPQQAA